LLNISGVYKDNIILLCHNLLKQYKMQISRCGATQQHNIISTELKITFPVPVHNNASILIK